MLTKRIIPCLDVKAGRVVKGVSFVNLRDAIAQKGFAPAFECAGDACGPSFGVLKYAWDNKNAHLLLKQCLLYYVVAAHWRRLLEASHHVL